MADIGASDVTINITGAGELRTPINQYVPVGENLRFAYGVLHIDTNTNPTYATGGIPLSAVFTDAILGLDISRAHFVFFSSNGLHEAVAATGVPVLTYILTPVYDKANNKLMAMMANADAAAQGELEEAANATNFDTVFSIGAADEVRCEFFIVGPEPYPT